MRTNLKHTIFIVDDDPDDRESIKDAFIASKHNHEYVFFKDGELLMENLLSPKHVLYPKIILLDLNLPRKDGRDILKEIKQDKNLQPIPIVILTTSSSEIDKETCYRLGANCFVTKPNTYNDLISITDCIAKLWCA